MSKVILVLLGVMALGAAQPVTPTLSETEKLRIENINLRYAIVERERVIAQCSAALTPLKEQAAQNQLASDTLKLQKAIEDANPGYTFDISTGKFTAKSATQK